MFAVASIKIESRSLFVSVRVRFSENIPAFRSFSVINVWHISAHMIWTNMLPFESNMYFVVSGLFASFASAREVMKYVLCVHVTYTFMSCMHKVVCLFYITHQCYFYYVNKTCILVLVYKRLIINNVQN